MKNLQTVIGKAENEDSAGYFSKIFDYSNIPKNNGA